MMPEPTQREIDKLEDYVDTRASKESLDTLRNNVGMLVKLVIALVLSMFAAGGTAYLMYAGTNGRVIAIERDLVNIADRQTENNELLAEIERLLREP